MQNDVSVQTNNTATQVTLGKITLYFSYKTLIAFRTPGGLNVSENYWGTTTGKTLNAIEPNKDNRLCWEEFDARLTTMMVEHGLV